MKKILRWIDDNLEAAIASIFLIVMVTFTCIQIIGRHLLSAPFPWTEEMTRYMFVWMVFIAVGYAVKSDTHIRITVLRMFLKERGKILFDLFADVVSLVFAAICMVVGWRLIGTIARGGQTASSVMFLPIWCVYLVMPLGFLFYCARLLQSITGRIVKLRHLNDADSGSAPTTEGM